jgi:NADH-quinone oxidoreductase subunit J
VTIGAGLVALVLLRPSWPILNAHPDPRSAEAVGKLLLDKYMIAFEGAAFLILIGIFGAVFLARVQRRPHEGGRATRVAQPGSPPEIEPEPMLPWFAAQDEAAGMDHRPGDAAHRQHQHGGGA